MSGRLVSGEITLKEEQKVSFHPKKIQGTSIFPRQNSLHPRIYRLSFVFQLPCGESYGTEAFCEMTGITEEGITACVSVRSKEKPRERIGEILRER